MVRGKVNKVGYCVVKIRDIIEEKVVEVIRAFYKGCCLVSWLVRTKGLVMGVG